MPIERKLAAIMFTDIVGFTKTMGDDETTALTILENQQSLINPIVKERKGTIIKNGVKIVGPTIIGKNCLIEENTNIGENTSIGDESKIISANISNSIIMSNCTIEGELTVRDSIIASNSKIQQKQNGKSEKFLLGEGTQISI